VAHPLHFVSSPILVALQGDIAMRKTTTTLSFLSFLVAAATGCAADVAGPDDSVDPTDPTNPPELPVPLTAEGTFAVQSTFDVATNAPGTAGTVINYFINATDDPDDPTKFIVEQVVNALPAGSIKNTLQGAIPFVAGYLNDRLLEVAPDFVTKIIDVGDAFGQVAHNFGTNETLAITRTGAAVKNVTGLHFKVDNVDLDFAFADHGMTNIQVDGLQVALEQTGKLTIAAHKVPMKYGQALRLALDFAIIPMIDPSVSNLPDYLKTLVNCQAVGQYVFEAIGIGSASTFETGCNAGIVAAANALYTQLDNLDGSALEFAITGTARAVDRNRDGKMDDIQTGVWTGDLSYAGTPAPLATSKFFGSRM
jgi:hypothetical protein